MSFSTEVKAELCRVSMQRACCTRAEAYGVLLHASVFSHKEIRLSTENVFVARRLQALLQRAFSVDCAPQRIFCSDARCTTGTSLRAPGRSRSRGSLMCWDMT